MNLSSGSFSAADGARLWGQFKKSVVVEILKMTREAKKSLRNTYRKKFRRQLERLNNVQERLTVNTVTSPPEHKTLSEELKVIRHHVDITKQNGRDTNNVGSSDLRLGGTTRQLNIYIDGFMQVC